MVTDALCRNGSRLSRRSSLPVTSLHGKHDADQDNDDDYRDVADTFRLSVFVISIHLLFSGVSGEAR